MGKAVVLFRGREAIFFIAADYEFDSSCLKFAYYAIGSSAVSRAIWNHLNQGLPKEVNDQQAVFRIDKESRINILYFTFSSSPSPTRKSKAVIMPKSTL